MKVIPWARVLIGLAVCSSFAAPVCGAGSAVEAVKARRAEADAKTDAGLSAFANDGFPAAEAAFRDTVALDPSHALYYRNLGAAAYKVGHYADAIRVFARFMELQPKGMDEVQYLRYGQSHARIGQYGEAAAILREGTAVFPDYEALQQWSVVSAYAADGWDAGLSVWRVRHPEPEMGRDVDELCSLIQNGIKDHIRDSRERKNRYAELKHLRAYVLLLRDAMRLFDWSYMKAKEYAQERDDTVARIVQLYRALPLKPAPSPKARRLAAEALKAVQAGEYGRAYEEYEAAVTESPWWPDARFNMALAAMADKDYDFYERSYKQLSWYLEFEPDGERASEARTRMRDLEKMHGLVRQ